jgi:hypothetical protein
MVEDPFLVQNVHGTLPDSSKTDPSAERKITRYSLFVEDVRIALFDLFDDDEIRLIAGHDTLFSVSYQ